jgi:hypothetical protein
MNYFCKRLKVIYGMNFMTKIYITRNLHILWMYILDTTIYIKFIRRVKYGVPGIDTLWGLSHLECQLKLLRLHPVMEF